jgi:hypothetical protein
MATGTKPKKPPKREEWLEVCPNCGRILDGTEFLLDAGKMPHQVGIIAGLNFDPVAGRLLCPDCNYSGPPIKMMEAEHSKAPFEKRKIAPPAAKINPKYGKRRVHVIIAMCILFVLFLFAREALCRGAFCLAGALLLAYLFYIELFMPKFKDTREPSLGKKAAGEIRRGALEMLKDPSIWMMVSLAGALLSGAWIAFGVSMEKAALLVFFLAGFFYSLYLGKVPGAKND